MANQPKIMAGARAIFSINNIPVAFATNVGYRISVPHTAINVLGRYSAARHEPTGYDVSVNCGVLRFSAATGNGNAADTADATKRIQPRVQDIISSDELSIQVIDRKTGETIIVVDRARLIDRGGSMNARDILSENWSFVGVIASDSDSGAQNESPGANEGAAS